MHLFFNSYTCNYYVVSFCAYTHKTAVGFDGVIKTANKRLKTTIKD